MKANVGSYDGAFRFVGGCALLAMGNHDLGWWGLIGIVPILSSITGYCPLYALLHIRTTACDHDEVESVRHVRPRTRVRLGH